MSALERLKFAPATTVSPVSGGSRERPNGGTTDQGEGREEQESSRQDG